MSKMTTFAMKKKLEAILSAPQRTFTFDHEKDQLHIKESNEQITLQIAPIVNRYGKEGDFVLQEIYYYVTEGFKARNNKINLKAHPEFIFPVIRSGSFPQKDKEGRKLCFEKHTAETMIYYVYDASSSYRFITTDLLKEANLSIKDIQEYAFKNLMMLKFPPLKKDEVAGNCFYFLQTNDGYGASRILNKKFLEEEKKKAKGEVVIAVPHQDVLILADIINNTGYDVLAHMNMQFFAEGLVPITSLPFIYHSSKLEPIFILAKNSLKE